LETQLAILWESVPLLVLLAMSAFFSGSETAFFNLGEAEVAVLREKHGTAGRRIIDLLEQPSQLLAALLIGNLLANILATVLATSLLMKLLGKHGLLLAVPVMTIVLLLVGEITPKIPALLVRRPIGLWVRLMKPVVTLIDASTSLFIKSLPMDGEDVGTLNAEELSAATDMAVLDAVLTETEGWFLTRLLTMSEMEVREIMTARTDCSLLEIGMSREQILETAKISGLNRYPVFDGGGDLPVGVFHLKDLLEWQPTDRLQAQSLHDAVFVPETKDVGALLTDLRNGPTHLNCVIDEHGDFVGLVTLEDCLETLTGPWDDESDRSGAEIMPIDDDHWLVAGTADLRGVNGTCGTRFELSHDYVTLAGFVMSALGRIPEVNDTVDVDGFRLTVLAMDGHKVLSLRIGIPDDGENGEVKS
jgi:magnesium and cobalt exporter, CNNM family